MCRDGSLRSGQSCGFGLCGPRRWKKRIVERKPQREKRWLEQNEYICMGFLTCEVHTKDLYNCVEGRRQAMGYALT